MKSMLFICYSDPSGDPRPNRMIRCLKGEFRVTVAGEHNSNIEGIEFIPLKLHARRFSLSRKLLFAASIIFRDFEAILWSKENIQARDELLKHDFDVIIVSDLILLPLGLAIKKKAKVIFDAHEYFARHYEYQLKGRLFIQNLDKYICSRYLVKCDYMITVSQGLAQQYHKDYGVNPEIIMSLPFYSQCLPSKIDPDNIRMIYHGLVASSRMTHLMVEMMDYVDSRFSLDMMLMPSRERYFYSVLSKARRRKNIRIIPPVPHNEIIPFTNNYDVGLFLAPPTTFNLKFCLPNKLFEFIQARLAIAIGPSIEMKKIVEKYDCGIISGDFKPKTLAIELNKLSIDKIRHYKEQSNLAAKELCYENNITKIRAMVYKLIGS